MRKSPKQIFLQGAANNGIEITWSDMRIHPDDVRYIRAPDATPEDAVLYPAAKMLCIMPPYRMN